MTSVVIIDCGIGNLRSVQKILEQQGADALVSGRPKSVATADAVILPGVGAFADAMSQLRAAGLMVPLREHALVQRKPILGICLGMQLLASDSSEGLADEDVVHEGLGIVRARVRSLDVKGKTDWAGRKLTLPHIGWNTVTAKPGSTLFRGIPPVGDFYFAHSYHVACEDPALASAWCDYGGEFVCGFEQGNIFAAQFHPEKSQSAGQRLLRNFVEYCAQRAAA